jgi:hypothetical protein
MRTVSGSHGDVQVVESSGKSEDDMNRQSVQSRIFEQHARDTAIGRLIGVPDVAPLVIECRYGMDTSGAMRWLWRADVTLGAWVDGPLAEDVEATFGQLKGLLAEEFPLHTIVWWMQGGGETVVDRKWMNS